MKHDTLTLIAWGAFCSLASVAADGAWRERAGKPDIKAANVMLDHHALQDLIPILLPSQRACVCTCEAPE